MTDGPGPWGPAPGPTGVAPGWYPDPAGGSGVRWWSGTDWTHDVSNSLGTWQQPPPPLARPVGPDPRAIQQHESRLLPWAQAALCVLAAGQVAIALEMLLLFNSFRHWISEVRTAFANAGPNQQPVIPRPPSEGFTLPVELVALASLIVLIVFFYWAAKHARDLGLPARLKPVWAVFGWIVPVVNLWFPCWILRDSMPPHEAEGRRMALRWWLLDVLFSVGFGIEIVARIIGPVEGGFVFVILIAWAVLEARCGMSAFGTMTRIHEEMTDAIAPPARLG